MEKAFELNKDVLFTHGGAVVDGKRASVSDHKENFEEAQAI